MTDQIPTPENEDLAPVSRNNKGRTYNTPSNLTVILSHEFPGLSWDETRQQVLIANRAINEEVDVWNWRCAFEAKYKFVSSIKKNDLIDAIRAQSSLQPINRVRGYLESLDWDGRERLNQVGPVCLKTDDDLSPMLFRRWLISAVARAFHPGCKVDTSLVLLGPQGIGKSTFLRLLARDGNEEWFCDSPIPMGQRDGLLMLSSAWIIELAEFRTSTSPGAKERLKAFLTSTTDTYRGPYARRPQQYPRRCVFAATTNEPETILTDTTGNRRFLPIFSHEDYDLLWLEKNKRQILAEATHAMKSEESWHPTSEEERALVQRLASNVKMKAPFVEHLLESKVDRYEWPQLLRLFKLSSSYEDRMRLTTALRTAGYIRKQDNRGRFWVRHKNI